MYLTRPNAIGDGGGGTFFRSASKHPKSGPGSFLAFVSNSAITAAKSRPRFRVVRSRTRVRVETFRRDIVWEIRNNFYADPGDITVVSCENDAIFK